MSTRAGGASNAPWQSLNLGASVGDDALAVAHNRRQLTGWMGCPPVWLHQVHGSRVAQVGKADLEGPAPQADAAWTSEAGVAVAVLVADCLPVLLTTRDGRAVAAAHAGWRGLAAGVLENTVQALCQGTGAAPQELLAWLGACIGPRVFEVGEDVLLAVGCTAATADHACFVRRGRADGSGRWLANLAQLARDRLRAAGVNQVSGGDLCTYEDSSRFFSFRRDGITGRHAAAIWRRPSP